MAFVESNTQSREEITEQIVERAQELLALESPLIIPTESKPWRASDIKNPCPRQVYYTRHARDLGSDHASVAALYGTTVHEMFQYGAPDEEEVFYALFEKALHAYGMDSLYDDRINWKAAAKPFSLAGFRDANPELKVWVMYQRYMGLDRVIYNWFWETHPYAVYRHPETGRLGNEVRLRATIEGEEVVTTADLMLTHLYIGEIFPVDWKTGRASEPTQLATYAMAAEKFYGLPPDSIKRGLFVMTGTGECVVRRGKIPEKWIANPEASIYEIAGEEFAEWREIAADRLRRLRAREDRGVWTPRLNGLCYNACQFRKVCPVGRAVQEIKGEKQ